MKLHRLAAIGGVVLMAALMMSCNTLKALKARDQLNKGVTAFRNAQFQTAITHFKNAVQLDPRLLNARLYLATAYSQLYVPGGESDDNIKIGKQAIAAYEDVLQRDPSNTNAMASIAQIYYGMKDFEKAKALQQRILKVEPNNPDPYNWIGQLDWAICYPRRMKVRKDLKIANPRDPTHPSILPPLPKKARQELQDENGPLVEEGIAALKKALQLRPNDFTALSYLNLMYREKADLEDNTKDRDADLAKADKLVQEAMGVKKAEQSQSSTTAQ